MIEGLERAFGRPEQSLAVAEFERRIVGFGKTGTLRPPPGAPANCIPEGCYLTGLVVAPELRRRGVGHELTHHRLERIFEHEPVAYYFATAINRPTIALHERLGFREIARDIWVNGASFTGGMGVLFALRRDDWGARHRAGRA